MKRTVCFAEKASVVFEYEPFPWFDYEEMWKSELELICADQEEEDSDDELPESAFLCAVADPDVLHIPRLPNRRGIIPSSQMFVSSRVRTVSAVPVSMINPESLCKLSDTAEKTGTIVGSTFLVEPSHDGSGRSKSATNLRMSADISDDIEGDVTRRARRTTISMSFIDSSPLMTEDSDCATQEFEILKTEALRDSTCVTTRSEWTDINSVVLGGLSAERDSSTEDFIGTGISLPIKLGIHTPQRPGLCEDVATPSTTSSASAVGTNAIMF